MVELDQRAGIEKIAGQGLAFPTLGNDVVCHRSGNLGKPSSDFLDTRGRLGVREFPFDLFDVFDGQTRSVMSHVFDDAYEYVLVFLQIQWLQGPQHTILVNGVNLERHATIVQPRRPLIPALPEPCPANFSGPDPLHVMEAHAVSVRPKGEIWVSDAVNTLR
jgi:hypothetical protein